MFGLKEPTIVWRAIDPERERRDRAAAHTAIAGRRKAADDVIGALDGDIPLPSVKLDAHSAFTLQMLRRRETRERSAGPPKPIGPCPK
jgi:hypothetical protein